MVLSTLWIRITYRLNWLLKWHLEMHAKQANSCIVGANHEVEVVTPEDYMGDIHGDLNRRRGLMEGMDDEAGSQVIKAKFHCQKCLDT